MPEETEVQVVDKETGEVSTQMQTTMALPQVNMQAIKSHFHAYQDVCKDLLKPEDYTVMEKWNAKTRQKDKQLVKNKSAWRKLALAFSVSVAEVKETRRFNEDGRLCYSVTYRASFPNGRSVEGDGMYTNGEKKKKIYEGKKIVGEEEIIVSEHTVRATAHTRAKNRAISDLLGVGEVSAEEINVEPIPREEPAQVADKPKAKAKEGEDWPGYCDDCGDGVAQNVLEFLTKSGKFDAIYCFDCQKKH